MSKREEDFTLEELRKMVKEKEEEEAERKRAEAALKAKKLAEEKESRKNEIETAEKHLTELYKSYIEDYGSLTITHSSDDYDDSFMRLLKRFWF